MMIQQIEKSEKIEKDVIQPSSSYLGTIPKLKFMRKIYNHLDQRYQEPHANSRLTREIYNLLDRLYIEHQSKREIRKWLRDGKPIPPYPEVKQKIISNYAREFSLNTLVETGTFLGGTINALKHEFRRIYSIELGDKLYQDAKERFRRYPHITLLQGDSGKVLAEILPQIHEPCLFWLDAHYSSGITAKGDTDTPIREELRLIFNHPIQNHVILIDDARDFQGGEYPSIEQVYQEAKAHDPTLNVYVENDIIRIHH